jgi:uncharacterized protein YcbK (DUF882 family)
MDWEKDSKYFKPEEFQCRCCKSGYVNGRLLSMLNQAREIMAVPIVLTSAFRCEKHNKDVGGKPNSAHLTGEAVDIKVPDGAYRYALIKALFRCGFGRIGIADDFVHVDVSVTLPAPRIWTY